MITKLAEQTDEQDPEYLLVILEETDDGHVEHRYEGDEVAEALTIPGGMVQVIDMDGDRYDAHANSFILVAKGDWQAWVGGQETRRLPDVARTVLLPNDEVMTTFHGDRPTLNYGSQINRVKRSELCVT